MERAQTKEEEMKERRDHFWDELRKRVEKNLGFNPVDDFFGGIFDQFMGDGKLPPGLPDKIRNELEYRAMVAKQPCPTCLTIGFLVVHK